MSRTFYSYSKVFRSQLTAKSKLVYIYLCRMADHSGVSFPSRKTIAGACSLSIDSIKRATKELVALKFIEKIERYTTDTGRQTSNTYKIVTEDIEPYFYLDSTIFDYDIPTNAKLVFTYILRCSEQKGSCFPSYDDIATACSLTVPTARKHIDLLLELGLLTKERQYRENGGNSNNLYSPQTENLAEEVEKIPDKSKKVVFAFASFLCAATPYFSFYKYSTPAYENKAPP